MKASEMLRAAAELIHKGRCIGACAAIQTVAASGCTFQFFDHMRRAQEYFEIFRSVEINKTFWWEAEEDEARMIALLLAAEIAENEGD